MRAIINYLNGRLQQMPRGLSLLTNLLMLFAFLFPVLTILTLTLPVSNSHFVINGAQVTRDEFLRRDGFLPFLCVGVYCGVAAYGLLHASRWSRPLLLLPPVAGSVLAVIRHSTTMTVYNCMSSVIIIALGVWYLFFRQTVRDYFAAKNQPVA
jgi:hypothetical protein